MGKAEVKQIADFLNDVQGGLREGDKDAILWLYCLRREASISPVSGPSGLIST